MSQAWNEGYFTDVAYTYGCYRELNPLFQRFCLLAQGLDAPDPGAEGCHAELGFGQGVSFSLHAAATPGQFIGTDFNPAQAAHAAGLARAAGSGALVLDDSFEQLLARPGLPLLDSISLHGIWTWVSRENQRAIVEFARQRLKPGGVLYVSYNCLPGWSPAAPLRQLFALHDRYAAAPGEAEQRVEAALAFARALLAAQPLYARAAPQLAARLEKLQQQDRRYLAHEYFNREWNCMYFTDVVEALAPARLDWAASAAPLERVAALNLTAESAAFLEGIAHPLLREQARDYFVNQQFRRDLFVRGVRVLTPAQQAARWADARFVLLQTQESVVLKARGALGEGDLHEDIYRPVLAALAQRDYAPKSLRELMELAAQAGSPLPQAQWREALKVLVGMGAAAPAQSEAAARTVQPRCAALNAHLLHRARHDQAVEALASPVTGGGVAVSGVQQLFLLALQQGAPQPQDWARQVWEHMASLGQSVVDSGRPLESTEENIAALQAQAELVAKRLPVLRALQVV